MWINQIKNVSGEKKSCVYISSNANLPCLGKNLKRVVLVKTLNPSQNPHLNFNAVMFTVKWPLV